MQVTVECCTGATSSQCMAKDEMIVAGGAWSDHQARDRPHLRSKKVQSSNFLVSRLSCSLRPDLSHDLPTILHYHSRSFILSYPTEGHRLQKEHRLAPPSNRNHAGNARLAPAELRRDLWPTRELPRDRGRFPFLPALRWSAGFLSNISQSNTD